MHQRYCVGSEIGPDKQKRRFRFTNTQESWEKFAASLDQQTRVVLEATSNAFWIYDILSGHAGNVVVANPLQLRAIAQARVKTDNLDADILAQLLAADFIPEAWVPPKEDRELRTLLHHRVRLAKHRTQLKNKVHAALMRNGLTPPCTDLFGKRGHLFLSKVQLPGVEQIVLRSCLTLLAGMDQEIATLEAEIYHRAQQRPEVQLLLTIPGVNVLSAMTILAEVGDISRFPSAKKLTSYAGLVPRVHQSGNTRYTGNITKEGRSVLRWILVQMSHRAVQSQGALRSTYLRLKEKKGAKVAVVAVARKLLSLIWVVLTKKVEYRDVRAVLLQRKVSRLKRQARPYPVDKDLAERLKAFFHAEEADQTGSSPYPMAAD